MCCHQVDHLGRKNSRKSNVYTGRLVGVALIAMATFGTLAKLWSRMSVILHTDCSSPHSSPNSGGVGAFLRQSLPLTDR